MKSSQRIFIAVAMLLGSAWPAHAAFTAVDNFSTRTTGSIGGQGTWVVSADSPAPQVIIDPGNPINKVLHHSGVGDAAVALPAGTTVPNDTTGTFFLRVQRVSGTNDNSFGLNDTGTANPQTPGNYEAMSQVITTTFRGRDAGTGSVNTTPAATLQTGSWYKVWIVADNSTDTWKFYVQSDTDPAFSTQTELLSTTVGSPQWNFRNGTTAALTAAQFYGNSGLGSLYYDDLYIDNTGSNLTDPTFVANSDADGDGLADAWEVFYFGSSATYDGDAGATNIDNDGLTNEQEETLGTNPTLADTDGDGLNDGPEDSGSANLFAPGTRTNPADADSDDDGANDGQEVNGTLNTAFGNAPTDPNLADTDFDGWSDRVECTYSTNPNGSGSFPDVHELIGLNKRNGGFELINNGVTNAIRIATGWDVAGNDVDHWKNWTPPGTVFTNSGVEAGGTTGLRGFVQTNSATYNLTNYSAKAGDVLRLTYNRMNAGTLTANFIVDATDLALGIIEVPTSTAQNTADGPNKELVFKVPADNAAVGRKIGVGFKNTVAGSPGVDNVVLTVVDSDADADGLSDFWEDQYFGNNDDNPQADELAVATGNGAGGGLTDNDNDTFDNLAEQAAGSIPNNATSTPDDTDADGLADAWEISNFGSIAAQSGTGDPDGDFNSNEDEETAGTLPTNAGSWPDSEPDSLNDGWEKAYFSGSLAQVATDDPDGDGFDNLAEMRAGSHPGDIAWSPSVPKIAHRWSFNGDLNDSVGTSHATIQNDTPANLGLSSTLSATGLTLTGGAKATSDWAKLGANLLGGKKTPVTIELWATQNAVQNWSRVFDFHSGVAESLMMSWTQAVAPAMDRVQWVDSATSVIDNTNAPYTLGTKYHIVMVIVPAVNSDGLLASGSTVTWFSKNDGPGTLMGPAKGMFTTTNTLANLNDVIDALGRSPLADAPANAASATYDEVRIWDGSMPAAARQTLHAAGPGNPSLLDTDGDGLYDSWETTYFTVITAQDGNGNPDLDAANNATEQEAGSNPTLAASVPGDVDGDTLSDAWELTSFGNLEQLAGGDPDGDYDTNSVEEDNLTSPTSKWSFFTSTADTVSDSWKAFYGISSQTGTSDLDDGTGDLLDNFNEFSYNTNPTLKDTDGDGLNDGPEITNNANPLVQDTDGDGLLDGAEVNTHSSNPRLRDTDGDSFEDKFEVDKGTLPNDPLSFPIQAAGFTKVEDFEGAGMTLGQTFNGVNGWVSSDPTNTTVVADPSNAGNKVGQWVNGTLSKSLASSALAILQGNTGTLFFQLYQASIATDHSLGLSDVATPVGFGDYEAQFASFNATANGILRVRSGGAAIDTPYSPRVQQWMNVWIVANNSSDTVKVFVESPLAQTGVVEITSTLGPYYFRNGVATNALLSLLFVENTANVQVLIDNIHIDPMAQNLANPTANGDSDLDGMDDTWETTYGLIVGVNDAAADFDSDGTDNLTEFRLGLIPNSGNSRFTVTSMATTPGNFTLTWPSQTGVTFSIERSPNLAAGSWTTLQAAFPGTAGTAAFTDATAPVGKAFYRVVLNP